MKQESFETIYKDMQEAQADGYEKEEIIFVGKSGREYKTDYVTFLFNEDTCPEGSLCIATKEGRSIAIDIEDLEAVIY